MPNKNFGKNAMMFGPGDIPPEVRAQLDAYRKEHPQSPTPEVQKPKGPDYTSAEGLSAHFLGAAEEARQEVVAATGAMTRIDKGIIRIQKGIDPKKDAAIQREFALLQKDIATNKLVELGKLKEAIAHFGNNPEAQKDFAGFITQQLTTYAEKQGAAYDQVVSTQAELQKLDEQFQSGKLPHHSYQVMRGALAKELTQLQQAQDTNKAHMMYFSEVENLLKKHTPKTSGN